MKSKSVRPSHTAEVIWASSIVAAIAVDALGADTFEHYVPDMKAVVDVKNADIDTFIAGVAGMAPR